LGLPERDFSTSETTADPELDRLSIEKMAAAQGVLIMVEAA
jgi:hypothetical protein